MKRILSLLLLCSTISTFGQFRVSRLDGTPINNGDLFLVTGTSAALAEIKFKVTNISETNDINVKIKVVDIVNASGSDFQLCFGDLCFFAITEGSSYPPNFPLTLEPGQSNGNFDHFWNTNTGDGQNYPIDYILKFYQLNDSGVEIGDAVTITYRYQPQLSTSDFESLRAMGITLNQTVLQDVLSLQSQVEGTLNLFDLSGKSVLQRPFGFGENNIDVSSVASGMYLLQMESKGNHATLKVIKK